MKTTYVPTGSYWVGTTAALALEAMLGTCIGVALYDRESGVGGLHHIILPEPVYLDLTPERYATTGLPLFVDEICRKGALPSNLRAQVAGGALVGKLSRQDIDMDIGGRINERVMAFMKQARIPVEQSITGGFWGCRLRLEMDSFQVRIRTGDWLTPDGDLPSRTVSRQELMEIMDQLDPIPQVALKILRACQDEGYAMAELAAELKKDQVLSARTLKLANSAAYRRNGSIETIEDAVVRLGQDAIIKFVVAEAVENLFNRSPGGYSLCKGGLYHHSRKIALLCEQIAAITGVVKPGLAYLAGLLHDIGKVVLDQHIHNIMPAFYQGLGEGKIDILKTERDILGMDHTEAGILLAQKWDFAPALVDAIGYHHRPDTPQADNPHIAGIVHVADVLLSRFQPGVTISFPDTTRLVDQIKKIEIQPQQLHGVINQIPDGEFCLAA